ncbi:hypothetical protein NX059_001811 [Plenodomus lindquistii]|nr:hypothetical protein NX059_001811 [Plenodomus lindquistii]
MLLPSSATRVDAPEAMAPRFWIAPDRASREIAIVATLVSIALLSCLLRVYSRGRLLRTFAFDDGLALGASMCSIGVVATFVGLIRLGVKDSQSDSKTSGPWELSLSLINIVGISTAKLSGAFYLLRIFGRKYCRYLLYALIALILPSALTWFGSTLLRCVPVATVWDSSISSDAHCMLWDTAATFAVINNVINTSTDLILVLLTIPLACGSSVNLKNRMIVITVSGVGFAVCAAAIIRTKMMFDIWQKGPAVDNNSTALHLWSIIEVTTAIIAINIPTLTPLATSLKAIITTRRRPKISAPIPHNTAPPQSSVHSRYSSQTVIYRPNTAHVHSLTRFHDDESNLTFDIETLASRPHTRTHTMHTRTTGHSRRVSDWSQFSGFTYYTNPSEPPDMTPSRTRDDGEGLTELEEIIRSLGLDKKGESEGGGGAGLAVAAMRNGTPHERASEGGGGDVSFQGGDGGEGDVQVPRTRKG